MFALLPIHLVQLIRMNSTFLFEWGGGVFFKGGKALKCPGLVVLWDQGYGHLASKMEKWNNWYSLSLIQIYTGSMKANITHLFKTIRLLHCAALVSKQFEFIIDYSWVSVFCSHSAMTHEEIKIHSYFHSFIFKLFIQVDEECMLRTLRVASPPIGSRSNPRLWSVKTCCTIIRFYD